MIVNALRYILALVLSVALGVLLLIFAASFPQDKIDENVKFSAEIMLQEGNYPAILDRSAAGTLDYYTDALMLMESKAMTKSDLTSVLSNPRFRYDDKWPVECLYEYTHDVQPESVTGYVRYWMGFRAVLRILLTVFNYYQIKRYVAFAFFTLFLLVVCTLSSRINSKIAFWFALSVILVRPTVISDCLQYSCCFLIAFAAMLFMPWVVTQNSIIEKLVFFEIGIITMYFDFYTTPVITLGFPLLYLYLLCQTKGKTKTAREIFGNAVMWLIGYGSMWIAKLMLTTAFTSYNGFENGFSSLIGWLNPVNSNGGNAFLLPISAIINVIIVILTDRKGVLVYAFTGVVICFMVCRAVKQKNLSVDILKKNINILIIGSFPILWFIVAAKPTSTHSSFQYRSVALIYWCLFSWLSLAYTTKNKSSEK